jgi:peptide/nickel transport system permease protein
MNDLIKSFVKRKLAVVGLLLFSVIIFLAVTASWIAPHDPLDQELMDNLLPPAWSEGGDPTYLLGTDHFGRDVLSRLLYGARISLVAAGFASLFAMVVGTFVGLIGGYFGGRIDSLLMRIVDVFLSFPLILIALSLASILGPNLRNLIIVMAVTGWMVYSRVIRSEVISLKHREFILAAISIGVSTPKLLFGQILPNIISPALVLFTFNFAQFIILESALSFLGLGVPPPTPTWGRMLYDGRDYLTVAWWIVTFAGLSIMVTTLSLNFVGDGLRDALDPRLRRIT